MSSETVKSFLIKYVVKNKCSICNKSRWNEKPLTLEIDHINGINNDNRLQNLRLLCPNCHSQTETYCAKNKKCFRLKKEKIKNFRSIIKHSTINETIEYVEQGTIKRAEAYIYLREMNREDIVQKLKELMNKKQGERLKARMIKYKDQNVFSPRKVKRPSKSKLEKDLEFQIMP